MTLRARHDSHSAQEVGSRVAVVRHLAEAHGWRGSAEVGEFSLYEESLMRTSDGPWWIPVESYLAVHRELHALADMAATLRAVAEAR